MSQYRDFGPQDDPDAPLGDARFLGVNNRLQPDQLEPGMLADARNARLRTGHPETRPGVVKPGWLNVTRPGVDASTRPVGTFYGAGTFRDPNGGEWVLLAADGQMYRCRPQNARFALPLPAGVKLLTPSVPVQAFNAVFLFRGRHLQPLVLTDLAAGFVDVLPRWSAAGAYQAAVQAAGLPAQEVAYGPFQAVTSITSVGQTATVVTPGEHGFITGADVVITGAVQAEYNGRVNITVLDVNTFTYAFAGSATSPATGVITVSNMASYWRALGTVRTPLASLNRVGTTATATFNAHGFANGQSVTISGAAPVAYNGIWVIQNVTANTFDFILPADPGANATGVISARTSVVLAGQSPDTHPEAWLQIFNVLPNADDAIFIDNRLLVPTAYTPGAASYDSTSTYTKKDFIVAMDIGDNVHFLFTNELRINQGSNDEIVSLVKYDADTVVVLKGQSWGVLTGLAGGDLTQVALDMRQGGYGSCAPRAGIVAGKNVLFPSSQRGICSLAQNVQGLTRSVDVPLSNDIEATIQRIDWTRAGQIRMAWWDDRLYAAVPLLDEQGPLADLVPAGAQYGLFPIHPGGIDVAKYQVLGLTPGQQYHFKPGAEGDFLALTGTNARTLFVEGDFIFDSTTLWLFPGDNLAPAPVLSQITLAGVAGANNALLIYDFRRGNSASVLSADFQSGQWDGYDSSSALCVQEFFTATYNGKLRLFFIGSDGWANLMEEAQAADQVADASQASGLSWQPINLSVDSRGYSRESFNRFRGLDVVLGIWNAAYSVSTLTGAAGTLNTLRSGQSFSRTQYLKPVGKPDYVEGNANGDFATPGRGDYSVRLLGAGITPGHLLGQFQEVIVRLSSRPTLGRYLQIRITNSQGRVRLKSIAAAVADASRRQGVLV